MATPVHITAQSFEREVARSGEPVLVDFWAAWCGPCRMVAPVVEVLAGEYTGTLKVAKLDVDEAPELANRFHVQSIPTLALFVNGQIVKRIVGYVPKAELKQQIDAALAGTRQSGATSANVRML